MFDLVEPSYYIAPLLTVILTVGFLLASRRHISGVTAGICIVISYLAVVTLRFPWRYTSSLGGWAAILIAMAVPMIAAAGVYGLTGSLRPIPRAAVSTAVGLLGVLADPFLGLILVCAFTGDCL